MDKFKQARAVNEIAEILSKAKVVMKFKDDAGMLSCAKQSVRNEIVSAYRNIFDCKVTVEVSFDELPAYFHNAHALMYGKAFELIDNQLGPDIDAALWRIQNESPCDCTVYKMKRELRGAA